MNVDTRALTPDEEITTGAMLITSKLNMYGLLGRCISKDRRSGNIKTSFDKNMECAKVHDPFMGQKAIEAYSKANSVAVSRSQ
jgi:hypothetical protein